MYHRTWHYYVYTGWARESRPNQRKRKERGREKDTSAGAGTRRPWNMKVRPTFVVIRDLIFRAWDIFRTRFLLTLLHIVTFLSFFSSPPPLARNAQAWKTKTSFRLKHVRNFFPSSIRSREWKWVSFYDRTGHEELRENHIFFFTN